MGEETPQLVCELDVSLGVRQQAEQRVLQEMREPIGDVGPALQGFEKGSQQPREPIQTFPHRLAASPPPAQLWIHRRRHVREQLIQRLLA